MLQLQFDKNFVVNYHFTGTSHKQHKPYSPKTHCNFPHPLMTSPPHHQISPSAQHS